MDTTQAYRKGWDASKRTQDADMDAAESRFLARHGHTHRDAWCKGWIDHAADMDYAPPVGAA